MPIKGRVMSRAKDLMFDLENEKMHQWMHETFSIPFDQEIEEDTPEWNAMAEAYQDKMDGDNYDGYLQWIELHPYEEIYGFFKTSFKSLVGIVEKESKEFSFFYDPTILKMAYVHSVTLFEAMVGDMIKSAIIKRPYLMNRMVEKIDEFNKAKKYTLKEIHAHAGGVNGIVLDVLASLTFHNVETTKKIIGILSPNGVPELNLKEMKGIIEKRHDFVHRNGRMLNDNLRDINREMVLRDMKVVDEFANEVYQRISGAMNEGEG